MDLRDAVLCVECDWIFDHATHCPRCGCSVTFPIARNLNRRLAAVARLPRPTPPPARLVARSVAAGVHERTERLPTAVPTAPTLPPAAHSAQPRVRTA